MVVSKLPLLCELIHTQLVLSDCTCSDSVGTYVYNHRRYIYTGVPQCTMHSMGSRQKTVLPTYIDADLVYIGTDWLTRSTLVQNG